MSRRGQGICQVTMFQFPKTLGIRYMQIRFDHWLVSSPWNFGHHFDKGAEDGLVRICIFLGFWLHTCMWWSHIVQLKAAQTMSYTCVSAAVSVSMEAQEDNHAFCATSEIQRRRCNLSAVLHHGGPLCTLLSIISPVLWRKLSTITRIMYSRFQSIDNTFGRIAKQRDFLLPTSNEMNTSFPWKRTATVLNLLSGKDFIPHGTVLATSSITYSPYVQCLHCQK